MNKIETGLRTFTKMVARPYLQAAIVPEAPVLRAYYSGIMMQGVIPPGRTIVSYYSNTYANRSLPNQIKPVVPNTRIFVGVAPDTGIYTGIKNGRY